jgi:hypothetical protein
MKNNDLINSALEIIDSKKNILHDVMHTVNVIASVDKWKSKLSNDDYQNLILAAAWHDVGRNDYFPELEDHASISARLLKAELKRNNLEDKYNIAFELINKHRNRKGTFNVGDLTGILKDCDKLDIINTARLRNLIFRYDKGIYAPYTEFNIFHSLRFLTSITESFSEKLYTNDAKDYFNNHYPVYRELLDEYVEFVSQEPLKIYYSTGQNLEPTRILVDKFNEQINNNITFNVEYFNSISSYNIPTLVNFDRSTFPSNFNVLGEWHGQVFFIDIIL